jgi:hypothetical protein
MTLERDQRSVRLTPPCLRTILALYPAVEVDVLHIEGREFVHVEPAEPQHDRLIGSGSLIGLKEGTFPQTKDAPQAGCIGMTRKSYLKMEARTAASDEEERSA